MHTQSNAQHVQADVASSQYLHKAMPALIPVEKKAAGRLL